jgi:hypothetical protein
VHRDGLGDELRRLAATHPPALVDGPPLSPDALDALPTPVHLRLAPWATGAAGGLHERFGDDVDLVVGFLRYPSAQLFAYPVLALRPPQHFPMTDPDELEVGLRFALQVPSGHDTWGTLEVRNLGRRRLEVLTGGHLVGRVVDPRTGEGVGGPPGAPHEHPETVGIEAGGHAPVYLRVGTASLAPGLGYAVPAGEWHVDTLLHLGDGRILRTHPLPLTVT